MTQLNLVTDPALQDKKFPQTRYQGSKLKLSSWLESVFSEIDFQSSLDAFGGTASASYVLKKMGKTVHYNDILKFNAVIGEALIENSGVLIEQEDLEFVLGKHMSTYRQTISKNFQDIYYLDNENEWLDLVVQNIYMVKDRYKQAGLFWALFQACISKRPYNLFHRKNLNVRTSEVKRSFGNKATWDKPFEQHFKTFVNQFNHAVFDNGRSNKSFNMDAFDLPVNYDLVYVDTPYIPQKGSLTNYHEFYHFLEGICNYDTWDSMIDHESKHKKIQTPYNVWCDKKAITSAFNDLFSKFRKSIMVISYRGDGIPSVETLIDMLKDHGKKVRVETQDYKYVLSTSKTSSEVLIIAE